MTNEEFKRTLWEAADKLRGSVSAAEYKYPVLGLVFLKYVSDMFDAQADVIRKHQLEASGGLTYAEMGQYQSAENPTDPKGTNDEAAAAKDPEGAPIANGARNLWVTETALTTALNTSYMAAQLSVFGIVVGIALLLTGVGLMILALAVLGGRFREEAAARAGITTKVATGH